MFPGLFSKSRFLKWLEHLLPRCYAGDYLSVSWRLVRFSEGLSCWVFVLFFFFFGKKVDQVSLSLPALDIVPLCEESLLR